MTDKFITNADIIRSMTNEQLAEFLVEEQHRLAKIIFDAVGFGIEKQFVYVKRLAWLNSEVKTYE